MIVSVGCIVHYTRRPRSEFNPLLHLVLPVAGMVLFFFPLYYQFYKAPPTYPVKAANWVAIEWAVIGIALTAWLAMRRPERLADMERVYVEGEPEAPPARTRWRWCSRPCRSAAEVAVSEVVVVRVDHGHARAALDGVAVEDAGPRPRGVRRRRHERRSRRIRRHGRAGGAGP
jgi:hypothetical protein